LDGKKSDLCAGASEPDRGQDGASGGEVSGGALQFGPGTTPASGVWREQKIVSGRGGAGLVQVLLEAGKEVADLRGLAEVGHCVLNRVVVADQQQGPQFLPAQLLNARMDVMGQDKVEEGPLLGVEVGIDIHPRPGGPGRPRQRGQRIGDVRQDIEQVALLRVYDLLHLGQLGAAETFFRKPLQQLRARIRRAPEIAQLRFALEEIGQLAEEPLHELPGGHGRAVRMPEGGRHHMPEVALLAVGELHFHF